jgi:BirA family biotin operon repressor/biotin-[acetyl-CoA-carboxylase] ligase
MNLVSQLGSGPPRETGMGGWTLREYAVVESTNLLAAALPPWHAVRADTQTGGRGRFQRAWVSDEGGLWLSAVLPTPAGAGVSWRLLPLGAGVAVCEALEPFGLSMLRMRWPNDLLVGDKKICGLLLEQFAPDRTVVGIGLNVQNRPEAGAPSLRGQVARLGDFVPRTPDLNGLAGLVLDRLRAVWTEYASGGVGKLSSRLNRLWAGPRQVEVELDRPVGREPCSGAVRIVRGQFLGVDEAGRLRLAGPQDDELRFEPHEVRHLIEIKT